MSAGERLAALLKYGSDVEVLQVYHVIRDGVNKLEGGSSTGSNSNNASDDDVSPNPCTKLKPATSKISLIGLCPVCH